MRPMLKLTHYQKLQRMCLETRRWDYGFVGSRNRIGKLFANESSRARRSPSATWNGRCATRWKRRPPLDIRTSDCPARLSQCRSCSRARSRTTRFCPARVDTGGQNRLCVVGKMCLGNPRNRSRRIRPFRRTTRVQAPSSTMVSVSTTNDSSLTSAVRLYAFATRTPPTGARADQTAAEQDQRRGLWDGNGSGNGRTPSHVIESEGSRRNTVEGDLDPVECQSAPDSRESSRNDEVRARGEGKRPDRCRPIKERECRPVGNGAGSQEGVPIPERIDQRRKRQRQHAGVVGPGVGHDRRRVDVIRRIRPDVDGHAAVPQTVLEEDWSPRSDCSIDGQAVDFGPNGQT
jgi:hypothetical protein